jgi:hypothetical protein
MDRLPKLKIGLARGGGFTPNRAALRQQGWRVRPGPKKAAQRQPDDIAGCFVDDMNLRSAAVLEILAEHAGLRACCSAATLVTRWQCSIA